MENQEIIRAYLLEPGDIFKIREQYFVVTGIEDNRILYKYLHLQFGCRSGYVQEMGANSREKLILITNKTKQNEHQN